MDKTDFETRRENQDFGRKNNYMIQPTLELTNIGLNMTKGATLPIDSLPIRTKLSEPTTLTQPTCFPEQNGKAHIPGGP